uniref:Protein E6 n=1 Tax=Steinernema glaseri TaxID=37863 RepID=A0A1I7YMG5_9BILA
MTFHTTFGYCVSVIRFRVKKSFTMRIVYQLTFVILLLAPFSAQCMYTRVCGMNLTLLSTQLCTYPGMSHPCYRPFVYPDNKKTRREFMGDICCRKRCSKAFLKSFCCFTHECLQACYQEFRPHDAKVDYAYVYDDIEEY